MSNYQIKKKHKKYSVAIKNFNKFYGYNCTFEGYSLHNVGYYNGGYTFKFSKEKNRLRIKVLSRARYYSYTQPFCILPSKKVSTYRFGDFPFNFNLSHKYYGSRKKYFL